MRVQDLTIPGIDGFELAATLCQPDERTEVARFVLIASATGVKRRYYQKYAAFLCKRGFTVLTFDYRGIGDSRPRSLFRFEASMREWGEKDLAGVIAWVIREFRPAKLLLIGHSAGAQMAGLAPNNSEVTAMLAVAGGSGYWGLWPSPRRYVMAALWYLLIPAATGALTYFPAATLGLAEDLPGGVALEWARWCRNRHYMVNRTGQPLRRHFQTFRGPIFSYSFADDKYAPKAAVDYLTDCYVNATKQRRHVCSAELGVKSIGHFGFFRQHFEPLLWPETADWLRRQ